jgi:hypothetical protein
MERLLFVWDELDDWVGIGRHYLAGAMDTLPLSSMPADTLAALACLPLLLFR